MNINKSINSIVKTKKAPSFLLPRKSLVVVAVISVFSLLIFGFWYTFQSIALNPPTQNPPTGGGAIGVASDAPANSLSVASNGDVSIGGVSGKLNVGTIDPVYDINGTKYATYVSDFAGGVRVETSGVVKLENIGINQSNQQQSAFIIDFDKVEAGSDLWLFWQASNKKIEDVAVLPAPGFEGKAWYEKNGNSIIIYGDRKGEVSFRLSAPRVDYQKWPNLAEDQNLTGIKIEK